MTQPAPDSRHTVDSITDPMLTTLYNERDMLGRETDRLRKDYLTERTRAEKAEAALEQAELDAEQQDRNYRVLMNEKASYREGWKYEQQRRAKAEAALDAVRAELDRLDAAALSADGVPLTARECGMNTATTRIRAALHAHTNPKDQT